MGTRNKAPERAVIAMASGQVLHPEVLNDGQTPLHVLGYDMFSYCLYRYTPAQLNGLPVDAEVVLPIDFTVLVH